MKTKQNKTKQNINKHLFLKFSKNEESSPAVQIHHILLFHWRQNLIRQFQLKTNLKTKLLKDSGRTNWNFRENYAPEMYNKAIVIIYLWKEVYPQCASLTRGLLTKNTYNTLYPYNKAKFSFCKLDIA